MTTAFQKIAHRVKHQGIWETFRYLFGLCCKKCGIRINRIYQLPEQLCQNQIEHDIQNKYGFLTFSRCNGMEDFSNEDVQTLREFDENWVNPNGFPKFFQNGMRCAIARIDGKFGGICWYAQTTCPLLKNLRSECLIIREGSTLPKFRGRGILPGILNYLCFSIRQENADSTILIDVSVFNDSSIRGIEKAHFRQLGYWFSLPFYRRKFYWSRPKYDFHD